MQLLDHIQAIENTGVKLNEIAFCQNGQVQTYRLVPGDHCTNCYSIAKAFTMTAIGMLSDEGKIDVKKPVRCYMKDLIPADADPAWRIVTVENALTHRIGFDEGFLDIDVENVLEYNTDDYLDIVFHHPVKHLPGQHFQYSDAAFYLLSRLVSCVAGERLDDFLNKRLFQPLHFHEIAWSHCPHNYPMGATGLYISAGDLIKLPLLYLNNGLWEDKRLISEQWIQTAISNEYELHMRSASGWIGKGGLYGQIMLFNRERNSAVAWLGHTTDSSCVQRLVDYLDMML